MLKSTNFSIAICFEKFFAMEFPKFYYFFRIFYLSMFFEEIRKRFCLKNVFFLFKETQIFPQCSIHARFEGKVSIVSISLSQKRCENLQNLLRALRKKSDSKGRSTVKAQFFLPTTKIFIGYNSKEHKKQV